MAIREFESKVLETKMLNSKVVRVRFSLPKGFSFNAGQYLSITRVVDGKKLKTPYSIASCPSEKYGEFCVKIAAIGKTSHYISKLKKGDKVELMGPMGKFNVFEYLLLLFLQELV